MKNWILRSAALLLPALVLLGCSPDEPNAPPSRQVPILVAHNVLLDGPNLVAQAVRGVKKRGEQDEMLKLENSLPGFGGFFFDSTDQLTVYMKPSTGVSTTAIQTALANAYSNREPAIRSRMAGAAAALVIPGDYSLSELIAVENRIAYPSVRLPGFVGVGVSISKNRVKVGFTDAASMSQGVVLIAQIGVPTSVLIPEVWGQVHLTTSTFKDKLRPTFGGIQIGIMNRTYVPWDVTYPHNNEGSIGYDVHTTAGVHYMLTASHISNEFRGVNGGVGDTILQKGHQDYPYNIYPAGTVAINPAWDTGTACPFVGDTTQHIHADYCTNADAMLVSYMPGVTYTRGVGVSTTEGLNGAAGSQTIREAWAIADVWPPEMVRSGIDGVHKSGQGSGTTTGVLDLPNSLFEVIICMDPWDRVEENAYPTGCHHGVKYFKLLNAVKVNTARIVSGDSGGPVFAGNGSPYHALGILSGGFGDTCTNDCFFVFSKWSEIEARLGQGTLNPITGQ